MRYTYLRVQSEEECETDFPETIICAEALKNTSTSNICAGDSGGGLILNENGTDYVVAIVSHGADCTKYPQKFESVHVNLDWIYDMMGLKGNEAKKGQFPHHVFFKNENKICGGSIISSLWILTAAHCIKEYVA